MDDILTTRLVRWANRPILVALAFATAFVLAACQSSVPLAGLGLSGHFVYIRFDGNLWIQDAGSGDARILVNSNKGTYPIAPAISPDGTQVAYAASVIESDQSMRVGLQIVDLDGSGQRVVARPDDAAVTYADPAWSPDGKEIYFTRTYPSGSNSQSVEIDRIMVDGTARSKVVDGADVGVSPDGKWIVFQRYEPARFTPSLWIADSEGTGERQLMQDGVFAAAYGTRFSPDAQRIVFAASGPANKKLPGVVSYGGGADLAAARPAGPGTGCAVSLGFVCAVEVAEAHGLPWDLWLVDLQGT
ncbi:MAG: hypothetical protein M1482_13565, partial [Chloroflexi bacterium]|nr:hypothetical protein [Chloroflexota bacterium]